MEVSLQRAASESLSVIFTTSSIHEKYQSPFRASKAPQHDQRHVAFAGGFSGGYNGGWGSPVVAGSGSQVYFWTFFDVFCKLKWSNDCPINLWSSNYAAYSDDSKPVFLDFKWVQYILTMLICLMVSKYVHTCWYFQWSVPLCLPLKRRTLSRIWVHANHRGFKVLRKMNMKTYVHPQWATYQLDATGWNLFADEQTWGLCTVECVRINVLDFFPRILASNHDMTPLPR